MVSPLIEQLSKLRCGRFKIIENVSRHIVIIATEEPLSEMGKVSIAIRIAKGTELRWRNLRPWECFSKDFIYVTKGTQIPVRRLLSYVLLMSVLSYMGLILLNFRTLSSSSADSTVFWFTLLGLVLSVFGICVVVYFYLTSSSKEGS